MITRNEYTLQAHTHTHLNANRLSLTHIRCRINYSDPICSQHYLSIAKLLVVMLMHESLLVSDLILPIRLHTAKTVSRRETAASRAVMSCEFSTMV